MILSNAMQMGMDLKTLSMLRLRDFVELIEIYGEQMNPAEVKGGTRDATQEDIDRLLA